MQGGDYGAGPSDDEIDGRGQGHRDVGREPLSAWVSSECQIAIGSQLDGLVQSLNVCPVSINITPLMM